jgi:glycerophosphoryl diester phosphodiesterase
VVKNIAHRGGAGLRPENTLAAFQKATELNVDMIEFDLQPTKDFRIIVMHDKTIDRTTNGSGRSPELTFKYVRSLDAGSWFDLEYSGTKIPTLVETLEIIPRTIELNVEMKYIDERDDRFERKVYAILEDQNRIDQSIIAARWLLTCERMRKIDPDIKTMVLQKQRTEEEYLELLLAQGLKFAQLRRHSMNPDFIDLLHDNGIQAYIFYSDEEMEMKKFIKMGIDGILTNYPDRLQKLTYSSP